MMRTAAAVSVLPCIVPRALKRIALGHGRSFHCIAAQCYAIVAAAPVLANDLQRKSAIPSGAWRIHASSSSASSSQALNVLKEFKSRLEEPTLHRKPSSSSASKRADEAVRKSTLQGLATSLATEYNSLTNHEDREAVLTLMARECGASDRQVAHAVEQYQQQQQQQHAAMNNDDTDAASGSSSTNHLHRGQLVANLRHVCTPKYDRLFHLLLEDDAQRGMQFLVSLRRDLLVFMESVRLSSHNNDKEDEEELLVHLNELDGHLKNLLSAWFGSGMLDIRRITYEETSALVIETIAKSEAVHPMRSLEDLRTRLSDDHRVFAAFHPLLPKHEPIVFCHVALRPTVSSTMTDVLESTTRNDDDDNPNFVVDTTAVFYSISSTQAGLSGIDLGQSLLKEAMALLQRDFPKLTTFVTLSPIPRFRKWLQDKIVLNQGGAFVDDTLLTDDDKILLAMCFGCSEADVLETFLQELDDPSKMMEACADDLEPLLMTLAARYLMLEKHHGKPLDGVARFHIRNGAEMYQLNYRADPSRKGWHNSLGIMINYRYPLSDVTKNQLQYELDYNIPMSATFAKWLPTTNNS